jgi:NAD(P)-dependent dehydrogenase (short-subunit alcohol dehydrogenase family)
MRMKAENPSWAGRVVLISGAGGGLGSRAALALAGAGARLVLLDKAVNRLEQLHDDILAAGGLQPALYPLDLNTAGASEYAELAQILEQTFGGLHGLLHSAAELGVPGPLHEVAAADWERLLRVNLNAAHSLTAALLPLLAHTGDAAVVFTSDSSARLGHAYWGAYGVAKIALEGLARQWSEELSSAGRVRVRVFIPGPVRSPLRRKSHPGELPQENPDPEILSSRYLQLLGPASEDQGELFVQGQKS